MKKSRQRNKARRVLKQAQVEQRYIQELHARLNIYTTVTQTKGQRDGNMAERRREVGNNEMSKV